MNGSVRPVQLVLDTSAIAAFTAGSIAVGELIAEIDDEERSTGLPVLCVADASRHAADGDRLQLLVNHHPKTGRRSRPRSRSSVGSTPQRRYWLRSSTTASS